METKILDHQFIAICTDDAAPEPFCQFVDDIEFHKKRQQEIHAGNIDFVYVPLKQALAAPELLEALQEISVGRGAYSRDPLQHASNCIDNMVEIAKNAIKKATA